MRPSLLPRRKRRSDDASGHPGGRYRTRRPVTTAYMHCAGNASARRNDRARRLESRSGARSPKPCVMRGAQKGCRTARRRFGRCAAHGDHRLRPEAALAPEAIQSTDAGQQEAAARCSAVAAWRPDAPACASTVARRTGATEISDVRRRPSQTTMGTGVSVAPDDGYHEDSAGGVAVRSRHGCPTP